MPMMMMIMMMIMTMVVILYTATYFTSRASANIPAASGAEAEVPVCLMVHVFLRSVVACETQGKELQMLHLVALSY